MVKQVLDTAMVKQVLANPMAFAKAARVVPAVENGKPRGFKLYAIAPDSVYAKLGFINGDTIDSINGYELTSAENALEAYTKIREAPALQIKITRRGIPIELKSTIQ
jgi:general secretion pathway protein C